MNAPHLVLPPGTNAVPKVFDSSRFGQLEIVNLGVTRYADALRIMQDFHAAVVQNSCSGNLYGKILVTQHFPVVTMGQRQTLADLVTHQESLAACGVDFCQVDRGGSVTVHEPGQCVIYPILKLQGTGVGPKKFVECLEQAMIETCAVFGVMCGRDKINPGVWVANNKIGALGIRIKTGVTMHGLAFNIVNTLATFLHIVPCGIRGRGVTSLELELQGSRSSSSQAEKPTSDDFYRRVENLLLEKLLAILL